MYSGRYGKNDDNTYNYYTENYIKDLSNDEKAL
jgi:hypothetical protein